MGSIKGNAILAVAASAVMIGATGCAMEEADAGDASDETAYDLEATGDDSAAATDDTADESLGASEDALGWGMGFRGMGFRRGWGGVPIGGWRGGFAVGAPYGYGVRVGVPYGYGVGVPGYGVGYGYGYPGVGLGYGAGYGAGYGYRAVRGYSSYYSNAYPFGWGWGAGGWGW